MALREDDEGHGIRAAMDPPLAFWARAAGPSVVRRGPGSSETWPDRILGAGGFWPGPARRWEVPRRPVGWIGARDDGGGLAQSESLPETGLRPVAAAPATLP